MEINDNIIEQWEPKIQKFLNTSYVKGMEREDLAQELRIAIVKAARGFDETRNVSFHTYLHTTLVNTLRTLIAKSQKNSLEVISLDSQLEKEVVPTYISSALEDTPAEEIQASLELTDLLESWGLTPEELKFIELRTEGWTMEQITKAINVSAYKLRTSIQVKMPDNILTQMKQYAFTTTHSI